MMTRLTSAVMLALGLLAGAGATYWYLSATADEKPAKMSMAGDEGANSEREILYYRNPMGLPDTSPVPKKDSMGMDYIPVYADEDADDGSVSVSPGKVQRSGVRTAKAEKRVVSRDVRAAGAVEHDESLLTVVTVRSDGYIEDLYVDKTGQEVKKGEPLFRFYSPQIQLAQADLLVALRAQGRGRRDLDGAIQKMRNLGVPQSRIEEVQESKDNPRTLDWPSPTTGDVTSKSAINGQFVEAGEELFRIADHTRMWVIAEVAEADIGDIAVGTPVTVTLRAFPNDPIEAEVGFIYPEMRKLETRTIPVRIVVSNEDGHIKPGMYADVVFHPGAKTGPVLTVPASAVIDSGTKKTVLIAKGDGKFEPRTVKLGRRGDGYVEILKGVAEGDEVVTSATFLIDSESNLKAALQNLEHEEAVQ
jgi:Cu(I)/Ag(I) efflux system membrane fusion protein